MRDGGHICGTLRYIVCCKCSVPISCNLQELFWTWWTSQTETVERYEWPSWFGHRHSPCQNLACATCRSVNREEREGRGQKGWCISFLTSNFIFSLSLTLPPSHLSLSQPHQKPVFLLSVVLALVGAIHNVQLVEGRTVACHLGFQSPPNVLLTLDLLFPFLNDAQNTIQICQLLRTLPEYFCICTHLKEGESAI